MALVTKYNHLLSRSSRSVQIGTFVAARSLDTQTPWARMMVVNTNSLKLMDMVEGRSPATEAAGEGRLDKRLGKRLLSTADICLNSRHQHQHSSISISIRQIS